MAITPAEQELVDLEHQYWQAIKEKDLTTLLRLTDDPCIVTGAQGPGTVGRKAYEGMLTGAKWSVLSFALSDVQVRLASKDVAIIAYRVHEELDVAGEHVTMDAADASTWIRRDGQWVCSLHTESLIGDPYGRDRTPRSAN
ncbi:MAG TPA: nuclear transport factor 2 family protein [Gemmatimonadaceae bacterium]|nr:nuclear transport factor 2 family protein [Gemmatimonadaceae bacterium]